MWKFFPLSLAGLLALTGCATAQPPGSAAPAWPVHTLRAGQKILLERPPNRHFEASGLLIRPGGDMLTVADEGAALYRIQFRTNDSGADLIALTNCFTAARLAPLAKSKHGHFDCEGIAQDEQGRLYLCEEANRWILRGDPKTGAVEKLAIDWSPVQEFFSDDANASFEGIAIGGGVLYVANERSEPVIIEVDLATLKVTGHFVVVPRSGAFLGLLHYSDLCWFDGRLWVLCRQHRVVLEVDPKTHDVLAEYNFSALERGLGYRRDFPAGVMEGLAVDRDSIWLCTDNNGGPRAGTKGDVRPMLVKCPRPE